MFARQPLNDLAEQRRLLVMEATLHRSLIGLESQALHERLARWQAARGRVAAHSPLLAAGGALALLLAQRTQREQAGWISAALTALSWVRLLRKN